ncbi:MAG TPA: response regulator [bacterium]|nr:response regulator [bacterium]HOL47516.1 response regulator [bacterium]HPQ18822.1 response regulator [bacterium]
MKKKIKILIIDDDVFFSKILKTYLEKVNFEVDCLNTPLDITTINPYEYDVIILDMMMPAISGDILLSVLNDLYLEENDEKKALFPKIILSTSLDRADKKIVELYESYGDIIYDFLQKPYDMDLLIKTIKKSFENNNE